MNNYYITFGQTHIHRVNNKTFDKNTIALIEAENDRESRKIAFELFGDKFFTSYTQNDITESFLSYFPKGIINVK